LTTSPVNERSSFTEYTYLLCLNGSNVTRKIPTRHIARFWNNGEDQTWVDEEFARHVQFDQPLGFLQQNKRPFPGPLEYGEIYTGAGSLEPTMTRSVPGYPDENFTSSIHKLKTGVTTTGNGPIDIDQNIYFGGPVTSVNETPVQPWQVYRPNWTGSEFHQLGTLSGAAGKAYTAKVFSSDFGTNN
jgi:hypothetical protein